MFALANTPGSRTMAASSMNPSATSPGSYHRDFKGGLKELLFVLKPVDIQLWKNIAICESISCN